MKRVLFSLLILSSVCFAEKLWVDSSEQKGAFNLEIPNFVPVVEKLSDSVVNISSDGVVDSAPSIFSPGTRQRKLSNKGSGFVLNKDGLIVTNYHVVQDASKIQVEFKGRDKKYNAKVIGIDERTDLAIIQMDDAHDLKPVVLGDSNEVQPGEWVVAIGNPFNLGITVTVGVVSATERSVPSSAFGRFIQTDASINVGNSGGPLFNARGEVIGVNNSIFTRSGGNIGIGFAIPINVVKEVVPELKEKGSVTRGWLGVLIQEVTEDLARAFKLEEARGALVSQVVEDSPADDAGFENGDVIIEYDGKPVLSHDDLPGMVARTEVESRVQIVVIRGGKRKVIPTVIGKLKNTAKLATEEEKVEESFTRFGFTPQDITPDMAKAMNLTGESGVIVSDVTPLSAADEAGLQSGDIIAGVNQNKVDSVSDLSKELADVSEGEVVLLLVKRGGGSIFITLVAGE